MSLIILSHIYLGTKLEDKDNIIQFLKDEIEEFSKSKESPDDFKEKTALIIKKLNQDIIDLEINGNELKQQMIELENKHKDLIRKVIQLCLIIYYLSCPNIIKLKTNICHFVIFNY